MGSLMGLFNYPNYSSSLYNVTTVATTSSYINPDRVYYYDNDKCVWITKEEHSEKIKEQKEYDDLFI